MKTTVTKDGATVIQESKNGARRWKCNNPDQAAKMLATFEDSKAMNGERIAKGDASAIRDAANDFRKQRQS